jgi:RNA polymerase sigma factor (sigma-70 family)
MTRDGRNRELVAKLQAGDRGAAGALVRENRPLARTIANAYAGVGVGVEDLVQEGFIALLQAAETYDASRDVPFATYAGSRMRRRMARFRDQAAKHQAGRVSLPLDQMPAPPRKEPPDFAPVLAQLPREERAVVSLRFGLGDGVERSFNEVAAALGKDINWVQQVLRRALRRLRDKFPLPPEDLLP